MVRTSWMPRTLLCTVSLIACLLLFLAYYARSPENHMRVQRLWRTPFVDANITALLVDEPVQAMVPSVEVHAVLPSTALESEQPVVPSLDVDMDKLKEQLAPKVLHFVNATAGNMQLQPHQFLHLHHMKTGGTSIDDLISCSRKRLKKDFNFKLEYRNIHECSRTVYEKCLAGADGGKCIQSVKQASILSYCAPLRDLETFQWPERVSSLTVLRHPLDRVWSMFRFRTKSCFNCRNLTDVYADIDSGAVDVEDGCYAQLVNHQTKNLLTANVSVDFRTTDEYEQGILIQQAVRDLKSFFTLVGLTEELESTAAMAGIVFPWLNATLPGSNQQCTLQHKNASPQNNRCGPDGTHWELPAHPDGETAALIIQHNQLDLRVYEAAVEQFQLQKVALSM